ncbi:MAG: hypothetical protein R3F59_18165 [Myxococcota bacterium]
MTLSPPKTATWWVGTLLGAAALLAYLGTIPALAPYTFWLAFVGLVLFAVATVTRGL